MMLQAQAKPLMCIILLNNWIYADFTGEETEAGGRSRRQSQRTWSSSPPHKHNEDTCTCGTILTENQLETGWGRWSHLPHLTVYLAEMLLRNVTPDHCNTAPLLSLMSLSMRFHPWFITPLPGHVPRALLGLGLHFVHLIQSSSQPREVGTIITILPTEARVQIN